MPGISPIVTPVVPILPSSFSADGTSYVPGWLLAFTLFALGSILMILMIGYIFMIVFGQPMSVAKGTISSGGSIIQHFNTSKSAVIKDATIAGGAFRYKNVRDGTVAATTNSVNNISGRNVVLTFAQLGVTIPIPILGGISILVHNGINNIKDLKSKMTINKVYTEIYTENIIDPETGEEKTIETGQAQKVKTEITNETIISGYDFENFENLIKQSEEEKLIPLVIESVPNFVERNINADYTEKKIKIRQLLNMKGETDNEHFKIMTIALACVIIFIIGMVIK
jgi:hypothetical protein